ncbi:signal transduction histidine kinase LytS [Rivularia sp. UHCC 0363]|uniref:signal transduction histidine kinase LytS n=1 Tax=Rivularia sp. UHCC 0363 TaxID=3110244 RepID=UPI002B204FDE|nr:signal transduction histidine kinase LytS [Rivularia sp. UHCC 0363]MEA5596147.1 signal transduction histidine kinase LytS [Rivularia sp. UHCC 0363]
MLNTRQYKRAVGTFASRGEAEKALYELRDSGFSMDRVSLLAKNADGNEKIAGAEVRNERGENEAQEGAGIGATTGTVLGGLGGLLLGLNELLIPGVGPFLAAGTIATTLAGAGLGAAAGGIVGGLTGMGIPEEDARHYEGSINNGYYLLVVDGYEDEIERAGSVLSSHKIGNWKVFNAEVPEGVSANPTPVAENVVNREPVAGSNVVDKNTAVDHDVVEIIDKRDNTLR